MFFRIVVVILLKLYFNFPCALHLIDTTVWGMSQQSVCSSCLMSVEFVPFNTLNLIYQNAFYSPAYDLPGASVGTLSRGCSAPLAVVGHGRQLAPSLKSASVFMTLVIFCFLRPISDLGNCSDISRSLLVMVGFFLSIFF